MEGVDDFITDIDVLVLRNSAFIRTVNGDRQFTGVAVWVPEGFDIEPRIKRGKIIKAMIKNAGIGLLKIRFQSSLYK